MLENVRVKKGNCWKMSENVGMVEKGEISASSMRFRLGSKILARLPKAFQRSI